MKTKDVKKKRLVLVLNNHWLPVEIVHARDCFRLMCKAHALAVDTSLESEDGAYRTHTIESWIDMHSSDHYDTINTPNIEVHVPEMIVLTNYDKLPKRFVTFNKQNLFLRDNYTCAYCQCEVTDSNGTVDHIVPQAKGGQNTWENCITACKDCNQKKADHDPVGEFKPKKKATEPSHINPIFHLKGKLIGPMEDLPLSWQRALFHA